MSNTPGTLYIVATPIGNLDDITRRASDTLRRVDRILAEDTRHTRRLLGHLGIQRPLLSLHEHNEHAATERALESLHRGEDLAVVSDAGTPLISDPGFPLVRRCREVGIAVVPIPGVSALTTALSVSGLPTDRFCFEGFVPRKPAARLERLLGLADVQATLVFYESSHRIVASLRDMVEAFGDARAAVLARELTKLHETVRAAPLGELLAWVEREPNQQKGEIVVLVAGAARPVDATDVEIDRVLRVLLAELPLKQAVLLAARISGVNKNQAYQRALALSAE